MPRLGRSFPARIRPTRGSLSSLNFAPRVSPVRASRPRQSLVRPRVPVGIFPAPPTVRPRRLLVGVGL